MDDPGLKYGYTIALVEAAIAANPHILHEERRCLEGLLAGYPGVLVWEETIEDGVRTITVVRYPEAIGRLVIERRRRAALRGEDAA